MPEIGQTVSHYEILDNLGHGGMGEVFLAKDRSLNRRVALKFLPSEMQNDPIARVRFLREAQSAASLDHPNICTIYEVGEAAGEDFIVMEYVEGETLGNRLARSRPPLAEALRIASEVADALCEAHEHGIVHRDMKPANIMLTRKGRAIVMDFGLAKQLGGTKDQTVTETTLTERGLAIGTLAYMSPEQICGQPVDGRSDIFSFGAVLFEILSGAHPFRKDTAIATADAILHQTPPPLSLSAGEVPGALQRSVERMLAKDRESRCQSMAEIREQLKALLRQVEAGPEQLRWLKPPRRAVMLASSLVLVVMLLSWMVSHQGRSVSVALAFHERDWILVTDLENETGDSVFDKSLATALRISLDQSRYSNVFPQNRVGEALRRMRKTGVIRIDAQLGQEIALREGIKALLVPGLSGFGDRYRLTVAIRNPADGMDVRVVSADAQGKSKILGAVDSLAKTIRGDLGESIAAISQTARPLAKVTTPSLEALRLYSAGADKKNIETDFKEARLLFEKALEADPGFTYARGALGTIEYELYDRGKGRRLIAEAASQADQLPESEKYMLLAYYAGVVLEDWEGATRHLRALLVLQPDNAKAHHNLGLAYRRLGRYKETIDELENAARIDPHSPLTYNNLSITYLYHLGDPDAAIEVCRRQLAADPWYLWPYTYLGWAYVGKGKLDEARAAYDRASEFRPEYPQLLYESAAVYRMLGRYQDAVGRLRRICEIDPGESDVYYYLGINYRLLGREEAARVSFENYKERVEGLVKQAPQIPRYYLFLGRVLIRLGQRQRALSQIGKAMSLPPCNDRKAEVGEIGDYGGFTDLCDIEIADVMNLLGRKSEALDWIELAVQRGFRNYIWLHADADLESLQDEPRFRALMAQVLAPGAATQQPR